MKVVIAGSRSITSVEPVYTAIKRAEEEGIIITEVVSGGARGVDTLGQMWAELKGYPLTIFRPDWKGLGDAAGPIRNQQMAEYGDALIAVWDGKSRGTKNMIECMGRLNKPFHVETV